MSSSILQPSPRWVAIFLTVPLFSNPVPPIGKTGAPGDGRCIDCHTGPADNALKVEVDYGGLTYTPGLKRTLTVRMRPARLPYAAAFQMTARVGSNELAPAGHFEANGPGVTVETANGAEYVYSNALSGTLNYQVNWTPPNGNVGTIVFYVAAVVGDANAGPDGNVYSAAYGLRPAGRDLPAGFQLTNFDVPGSNGTTMGNAISNNGYIVGQWGSADNQRSFIRDPDGAITVLDMPGARSTVALGVNSARQVVGYYVGPNNLNQHGFVRGADGTFTTYDVPGSLFTKLYDINDAGLMVGAYGDSAGYTHALAVLNPFSSQFFDAASSFTYATGVNLAGTIVGYVPDFLFLRPAESAVSYHPLCQQVHGLSPRSFQSKINDNGEVAGYCESTLTSLRPSSSFIISGNGNVYYSPLGGYVRGINNSTRMTGFNNGHGTLLTPCEASPNTTSILVQGVATSGAIGVTAPAGCNWIAQSRSDWITIDAGGAGSGTAQFLAQTNPLPTARTGFLYVAGELVTVNQSGYSCDYSFTGQTTFGAAGGTGSVIVNGPQGCNWNASTSESWIYGLSSFGPTGYPLTFIVQPNNSTESRSGVILVGNKFLTIVQFGGASCNYTVTPASFSLPASGSQELITISTGAICGWQVSGGAPWIQLSGASFGTGPGTLVFSAAANPLAVERSAVLTVAGVAVNLVQAPAGSSTSGLRFSPVTPCRVADTRAEGGKAGLFGPPRMAQRTTREFPLPASGCAGIPANARAYSLNITVVPSGYLGYLTAWATGQTQPFVSTLNSWNGRVVANAAIVPAGNNGSISVYVSNDTDVIIDINGYFASGGLAFYPLTPCRAADTRRGQPIATRSTLTLNMPESGCGVPLNAQAYSLNVTAIPTGSLGFLTVWPFGQPLPLVSTLNSLDGQVVPNAAIVPAGAIGSVTLYASNETHVVVDVNGYFAPPGGSGALGYYTVNPCRVLDTRQSPLFGAGPLDGFSPRMVPVTGRCSVPVTARVFSLNLTAVPPGYLGFLTAWASGQPQPLVSTLNSWNGQVVANAALVPGGSNGAISVFASNVSELIVDINGYFAP